MSLFQDNLASLRARFPVAARRVEAAGQNTGPIDCSEDERRVLADCWLSGRSWSAGGMYCVSGWSAGWHVSALLAALPPDAAAFVAEAEPGTLRSSFEKDDWRSLLQDPRLLVGAGKPDEAFFSCLDAVEILHVKDVAPVVFAPGYNRAPAAYAAIFTEFARQVNTRRKLWGTAVFDAPLWQANTFANLPRLGLAPDVGALRNLFPGKPMVLISAGPSLDESLDFVRAACGRAVIVAVNSSYRAVRNAGVTPHFVLAADPREFTARGFEGVPVDGCWLITTPIVNPAVPALFEGRCLGWSGANELFCEVRRRCGLAPGTAFVEQGTVSACAVDLAVLLGCDRVCLVGQDLAVRTDGRSHAADSFYSDLNVNRVDPAACRMLPGNTLERVPVEEKLYVYLKAFEQLAARRPGLRFCNTARLGARIEGVDYVPLREALEWLGGENMPGVEEAVSRRVAAAQSGVMTLADIRRVIERLVVFAREVLTAALRAAAQLEMLPERYAAENYRDAVPVREAAQSVVELRKLLSAQPRDSAILEAGRARLELFRSRQAAKNIEPGAAHWMKLMQEREYAWAVAEGAWFLLTCVLGVESSCEALSNPR
ncbi:MAG: motility associated factor glycosyltransferase family protein [Opitutaceae bacterium]